MNQELLATLEYIEKEKSIAKETLLEALKQALLSACRKTYSETEDFDVQINPETADIRVLKNGREINDADFGRIAAQTAKQVIIQKIREAERKSIFDDFIKKQGDLASGSVHRFEKRAIIVDLGKTEGILPAREQSPKDEFRQGDYLKAYVVEVKKTPSGPEIILSRAHEGMVRRLEERIDRIEKEFRETIQDLDRKGGFREGQTRSEITSLIKSLEEKLQGVSQEILRKDGFGKKDRQGIEETLKKIGHLLAEDFREREHVMAGRGALPFFPIADGLQAYPESGLCQLEMKVGNGPALCFTGLFESFTVEFFHSNPLLVSRENYSILL